MTLPECLQHEIICAEQLTDRQLGAWALVIGIWALIVAVIPYIVYIFRKPIYNAIKAAFGRLPFKLVWKDATPVVKPGEDDEPSWAVSSNRAYHSIPAEVHARKDGTTYIYDIWVYATNTSTGGQNPQFVAHVYLPLNQIWGNVTGHGTVIARGNAGRPKRIPNYLETTYTVHAPDAVGTTMPLGSFRAVFGAMPTRDITVEFLYNITYYPRETYPRDRLNKFSVVLKRS